VFADLVTIKRTEKAIAQGVDGLVWLTAGPGGQAGRLDPFVFLCAAQEMFGGPSVLAGSTSDGAALWAAEALAGLIGQTNRHS
jgi:nitronate monooxygenase